MDTDTDSRGGEPTTEPASRGDPETFEVIGAAIEVHRQLGQGFLEAVYQEALAIEFRLRAIPFRREFPTPIAYKGERLECPYRADFVCYDDLLLELKALKGLTVIEHAQVLNYLRATGLSKALLLNFGAPRLEFKRFILTPRAVSSCPDRLGPAPL